MAIFGKRSKSKGATEEKKATPPPPPPQQQQKSGSSSNAARQDQHRGVTKNGAPMQAPNGTPLSPAERTAQRAALMAASRKRMNSENPDYSINGSFSSSNKPNTSHPGSSEGQASKTAHKTLVKVPKSGADGKKSRKSGGGVEPPAQVAASTATKSSVPESGERDGSKSTILGNIFQRTPPLTQDSPTLGYTSSKASPQEQVVGRSAQPSADSGYGSVTESRSDSRDARNAPTAFARVDSDPALTPAPTRRTEHEDKMLINPPTGKSRSRGGSRSGGGFVSRLDPGPTSSTFMQPVNFSKPSLDLTSYQRSTPPGSAGVDRAQQERPPLQPIQTNDRNDRGRSVYKTAPSSPSHAKPQPQYAQPARSMSSSSRGSENPFPYLSETISDSNTSRPFQSSAAAVAPAQVLPKATTMPTSKFNTLTTQANRAVDSKPSSSSSHSTKTGTRFADGATLLALQANSPETSKSPAPAAAAAPTTVPNVNPTSKISTQQPHSTIVSQPANHHPSSSNTSGTSTRRSTLPPVSVLEGYKVNKRGQVLDEEGDAIGELFEGDLIDCVRQKVNAEGEVIDEYGLVVGRVRPVKRGTVAALRYSEDSTRSGFQSPALPRSMGSMVSSDRRESNASQATGSQQPSRGRASSRVSTALMSQTVVSPVDTQGNAIIAELDASTVAESFPVMDQSDIFIPTFGSSTRNQSPSQLMKAELPADERRPSVASAASRDASPAEPRPKKWASRYFDPGPDETGSPMASRRNSQSPAPRPTLRTQSQPASRRNSQAQSSATPILNRDMVSSPVAATPTTAFSTTTFANTTAPATASTQRASTTPANWNQPGAYKAVLGPTLEDLAEEPPSRALSQSSKAGRSTPNLHSETQRGSVTSPRAGSPVGSRRASLQGGLGPRTSYQPMRRSPLSNYEATSSGTGTSTAHLNPNAAADIATRSVSQRASASVPGDVTPAPRESEDADAAPAPEIFRARPRPGKKAPSSAKLQVNGGDLEKTKSVDRRKSRFSMFLPGGGKKEGVAVS